MATIIGTEGSDTLNDTIGDDTIIALGGDDTILRSQGGADTIDGGDGNDRLVISGLVSTFLGGITGGPGYSGSFSTVAFSNIENFTIYHVTGEIGDSMSTGLGDDAYYLTATNNQNFQRFVNFIDLGGGSNDLIVIDASAVTSFPVINGKTINSLSHDVFSVNGARRIEYLNVERLHLIGGALGDTVAGLIGDDIIDGRDGNDTIGGRGGDDRLIGGNGDDILNGEEGNDTLVVQSGADAADGGNGSDRLEIDARAVGGLVQLLINGAGPYAGSVAWAGGTASASYSGIESFTIFSNAGNYADDIRTGDGDDVFYHYGLDDLTYLMDVVDLGGGANDLLVADFSAVTSYVVSNRVHPSSGGHYLFDVGGNGKIDYTGVERLHFIGGAQGDNVTGLAGADILEGRAGNDSLTGGDGNDDISGGTGTNVIDAGNNDDIIRSASLGIDTVQGGAGADTAIIDYSAQTAAVTNIAGGDVAFGNGSDTSATLTAVERILITTGSGNDDVTTLDGNDEIRTGAGTDVLNGAGGNDYLDGGSGADAMTGGSGDDVYIVDDALDTITELSGGGLDEVYAASAAYVLSANVENLRATSAIGHDFRGNGGNNLIITSIGSDLIRLGDGGNDSAFASGGDDAVYFGAAFTGADFADGGAGRDVVVLQGNYTLTLSSANLIGFEAVSLQSGANTTWGDTANNLYDYDITTSDGNATGSLQLIVNGQSLRAGEDFTFDGSAESGDGKYLVYGGHGVETFTGGAGNDVFFFEGARFQAGDSVDGGAGRDAVIISAGNGLTHIDFAADALTNIESISLNARYASDPTARPSYELVLKNGNVAPGATLIVNGSSIADPVQTVSVDGSAVHDGNLILIGGAGADTLKGGDGGDLIQGGLGADMLTGGAGVDTFRYTATGESTAASTDQILDFASGTDKISLSIIDADTFTGGDQAFHWIGSSAFGGTGAASAGELRAYALSGNWFVEGDVNGDGAADLVIQLSAPAAPIVQGDFLL
jgi:Ca2+-binding RTX toxin-like protein